MIKALTLAALLGASCGPAVSRAQEASQLSSPRSRLEVWGSELVLQPGVAAEMARFRKGSQGLDPAFAMAQAQRFRASALASAQARLKEWAEEGCTSSVEVTFPSPDEWGGGDLTAAQRAFLAGVVRTEGVACFRTTADPREALDLYTSPSFRKEAESRIERMWSEGEALCVRTGGVPLLLSPSEVCNQITRLQEADLAAEHSQVVRNGGEAGLQPVFFKESLKTFLKTPDGLAFHYVNYSRTADLGGASRWVAGREIRDSQERQVEALRQRIGGW